MFHTAYGGASLGVATAAAAQTGTLAFTGFAFGLYLLIGFVLIISGLIVRHLAVAGSH